MSDAHAGNPSSPTIDTRPSSQEPPDSLAVSARQSLPAVLNDAPFNGAAADYRALRQRLETKGHGRDAAEWAIHWHVQAGHLIAEPGYAGSPGVWSPGGRGLPGGTYRSHQRDDCRLQATPALGAWWRDSDKPTPSPNRLSAIADALAAEKARLDPIRRRFDEWDATCAQAADELYRALLAMFNSEIETRRTPEGVNPRLWVPHLLNAGRILRERGWIDLIDGRLSDAGYDRCGYAMLHETANGMSAATLGDEIDRLFAAGAFDQFTWQYVRNYISGALRDRHLQDCRRLYPELWPSSADQIRPITTYPQSAGTDGEPAHRPAEAREGEGEPPADPAPQSAAAKPGEGGTPAVKADPNRPSQDRQNDILAAIANANMPLQRPELVAALKLKTEGKLGHHLAWMVENHILINIPQRGYWPVDRPVPK